MAEKKGILTACLATILVLNWAGSQLSHFPYPDLAGLRLSEEDAVQTAALVSLGMRRLAADLGFIQLVLYYGTSLEDAEEEESGPHHGHTYIEPGHYMEMKARTMRMISLDPYFTYPVLYSAGALAFNLQRAGEAIELLEAAARWQPHEWKYRAYIAGIACKEKGEIEKTLRELTPVLSDPDCPTMLKNLLAYLNRQLGHKDEAIKIYQDILASKDPAYHEVATQALQALGAPVPPSAP